MFIHLNSKKMFFDILWIEIKFHAFRCYFKFRYTSFISLRESFRIPFTFVTNAFQNSLCNIFSNQPWEGREKTWISYNNVLHMRTILPILKFSQVGPEILPQLPTRQNYVPRTSWGCPHLVLYVMPRGVPYLLPEEPLILSYM